MGLLDVCRRVTRRSRIEEHVVDDLLAGRVPEGSEHHAHVARFVSDLQSTFAGGSVIDGTVTALVEAGHVAREKGDLPATVASNAHGPATRQGAGLPNWKRRPAMLSNLIGSLLGRVAVGAAATTLSVGAAGASNALPAPVQRVVSGAASHVGIEMPSPDDASPDMKAREGLTVETAPDASNPDSTAPQAGDSTATTEPAVAPPATDAPSADAPDDGHDATDDGSGGSDDGPDQGDDNGDHQADAPEQPDQPEQDQPDQQDQEDQPDAPDAPEQADQPDAPDAPDAPEQADQPEQDQPDQQDQPDGAEG